MLLRLGLSLKLESEELDELPVVADYTPITWRQLQAVGLAA